jgi:hypothetical protein
MLLEVVSAQLLLYNNDEIFAHCVFMDNKSTLSTFSRFLIDFKSDKLSTLIT